MLVHAGSCCTELLDAEATLEVDALNWNPPTLTLEGFLVADTKELEVIVEGFRTGCTRRMRMEPRKTDGSGLL